MSRWFKHIAALLIFTLALGACSRVGLAYRNLDVIIPWTLSDYLDMNGEQKDWFNERLKEHLNWHCTTQLPGYLDWLDRLQTMVENQPGHRRRAASAHRGSQTGDCRNRARDHAFGHRVAARTG